MSTQDPAPGRVEADSGSPLDTDPAPARRAPSPNAARPSVAKPKPAAKPSSTARPAPPQPASDSESAPEPGSARSLPRFVWLLVPAVLAAALVGLLVAVLLVRAGRPDDDSKGAVAVARQEAINFFSLDYREAKTGIDRVLKLATGSFARDYEKKGDAVTQALLAQKTVLTASVPDSGTAVEFYKGNDAQVVVAVNGTTKSGAATAQTNRYRVRVILIRKDNTWRVSAFNQVG